MNTTSNDPTKMPATIPNKPHNNTFSELFFIWHFHKQLAAGNPVSFPARSS
jgi:hypothetical protein